MRPRKARGTPGLGVNGVPGESMAEDKTTPPNDEVVAVSDEALQKAESFVEAEEGAANRLMGWAGQNLDHDRRGHEPVSPLRGLRDRSDPGTALHPRRLHAGPELPAVSAGDTLSQPRALVGHRSRDRRGRDHRLCAVGRRGFHRPRHLARPLGHDRRHRLHRAAAGGDAAHHRRDHARGVAAVHRLRDARPVSAGAMDPSRLRRARGWSVTSSLRWKAFSASPSTSRRR